MLNADIHGTNIHVGERRNQNFLDNIFFINDHPESIQEFIQITSNITRIHTEKWKNKVNEWKKKIDCDYDWGCEICPYYDDCEDIKDLLNARSQMDN